MRVSAGTRGSRLALLQTRKVLEKMKTVIPTIKEEIKVIKTSGDLRKKVSPGMFVNEINGEILAGKIDIGVHSLKDLPTKLPKGLSLACVPERLAPNDALISRNGTSLNDLTKGSVIGTSSPRRKAEVIHLRPDLQLKDIRGNIDTRIKKMEDGLYDGVIVALAALQRCCLQKLVAQRFELDEIVPAAGQGALAVVCKEDGNLLDEISKINDEVAWRETICERTFMEKLRFGCKTPAGVVAKSTGGEIELITVIHNGGRKLLKLRGQDPRNLGIKAAEMISKR